MVLSIFILSSAVGPLAIAPLSEVYGRRPVLHLTMLFFFVFNLACAFSRTAEQLLAFRFLAGIGGSAPSIGPGILGDCWRPEERGKSLGLYYIFTLLGPALGPVVGGFIIRYSDWRWMFYSTSALSIGIQALGVFAVPETFPPILLRHFSIKSPGNLRAHVTIQHEVKSPWRVLSQALIRPTKLILTQPIIQMLAIYIAYIYGLLYLALSTYVTVWTIDYGQTDEVAGLNYISMAIGFTVCTQVMARISDFVIYTPLLLNLDLQLTEIRRTRNSKPETTELEFRSIAHHS
jgi:multidrug resistance protein